MCAENRNSVECSGGFQLGDMLLRGSKMRRVICYVVMRWYALVLQREISGV